MIVKFYLILKTQFFTQKFIYFEAWLYFLAKVAVVSLKISVISPSLRSSVAKNFSWKLINDANRKEKKEATFSVCISIMKNLPKIFTAVKYPTM